MKLPSEGRDQVAILVGRGWEAVQKEEFRRRSFSGLTIEDVQTVDLGVFEQHIDDPP